MHRYLLQTGLLILALAVAGSAAHAFDLTVIITTQPVRTGVVGESYVYDVDAVSSDPAATVTYTLRQGPAGMFIDGTTGLIQWTPSVFGSFRVRVRVKARLGNVQEAEAEQEYDLRITGGAAGKLAGSVRDSAGAGLRLVEIKMFDLAGRVVLFKTRTDSLGNYRIETVAPGAYVIKADPPDMTGLEDQWYDGVKRFEDATPVAVAESSLVTINFVLSRRDADDLSFDLFGTVRDSAGAPLIGAHVQFLRSGNDDPLPHTSQGLESHGNRHRNRVAATAVTDSAGNYHVRLKSRSYLVVARKEGYRPQYWNHKSSLQESNRLWLTRDTTGIDFDLGAVPAGGVPARSRQEGAAELGQNYPNPFNPSTQISFVLPSAGRVRLTVYSMIGQSVATLVDGELPSGQHSIAWQAGQVASGLYYYRLEFGGVAQVKQMLLLR